MDGYIHRLELDLKMNLGADELDTRAQADNCYDSYIGPVIDEVITRYSQKYVLDIDSIVIDLGNIAKEDIPFALRSKLEDELDRFITSSMAQEMYPANDIKPESRVTDTVAIFIETIETEDKDIPITNPRPRPRPIPIPIPIHNHGNASTNKGLSHSETTVYKSKASLENPEFLSSIAEQTDSSLDINKKSISPDNPYSPKETIKARGEDVSTKPLSGVFPVSQPFRYSNGSYIDFGNPVDVLLNYVINGTIPWSVPEEDFHPEELAQHYLDALLSNELSMASILQNEEKLVRFLDLLNPEDFNSFLSLIPSFKERGLLRWQTIQAFQPNRPSGKKEAARAVTRKAAMAVEDTNTGDEVTSVEDNYEGINNVVETLSGLYETLSQGLIPDCIQISLSDESAPIVQDRLNTSSSGLVLFHPFLVAFFQRLGLVGEDRQFKDRQARIDAVHILHHIANPNSKHRSHMLHLEKVLCGLHPDSFVPRKWKVGDKMEDEIKALLDSVCEYWRPLNRTSAEGFRNSFIWREGLLGLEDDIWVLHVEQTAIDILLRELPWEISTILLPWSKRILLVDWQANY